AESRGRKLGRPIQAPDARLAVIRLVQPFAECRFQLMTFVRRGERLSAEPCRRNGGAKNQRMEAAVAGAPASPEFTVSPQAEARLDPERFFALTAPGRQDLDVRVHSGRGVDLNATPPVVVAKAQRSSDRVGARF